MHEEHITRSSGHPWNGRPGFDLLEYRCETMEESLAIVRSAEAKHWHPWLVHGHCDDPDPYPWGGVMYKPCGIAEPWSDSYENPHPGCLV